MNGSEDYYQSLRIVERSINKASTFYGFCSLHDAKCFPQLDRLDFSDPPLFFWQVMYRAAALEKYRKAIAVDFMEQVRLLDKGTRLPAQRQVQFDANFQKWSHGEGLNNLNVLLKSIEAVRKQQDFDQISYSYFTTDRRLPFAGVGLFQPSMTMNGKALQRVNLVYRHEWFGSLPQSESVCIAAIPMKSSTLLCLCSLRNHARSKEFIDSIRGDSGSVANLFLGAMMLSIENVFFTPSYLKTLGDRPMSLLKRLSSLGIAQDIKEADVRIANSVALFDRVSIIDQTTS